MKKEDISKKIIGLILTVCGIGVIFLGIYAYYFYQGITSNTAVTAITGIIVAMGCFASVFGFILLSTKW